MGRAYPGTTSGLDPLASDVLGDGSDAITEVVARARRTFPDGAAIVWEGDAATFQFTYVSREAEEILGYPCERWTSEPTFWADQVVEPQDRSEAVAYCALATAKKADHVFEYRARRSDGRVVVLRDLVRVIVGSKGISERLRGLMFDVSEDMASVDSAFEMRERQAPSRADLEALTEH